MARDYRSESEFGLPAPLPVFTPDGDVSETFVEGGLPAMTDKESLLTGGEGLTSADTAAMELRRIYALNEDDYGAREPKKGTS